MPTLVTTGQITIVDNNDARPITAFVTAANGTQQTYTKEESVETYVPNWAASPYNVLTAYVYVGGTSGATNVVGLSSCTNKKWSTAIGTPISGATGSTYTVNINRPTTTPNQTYFFECDYTDPITGLVSHIIAQITLGMVKTGTNAVYAFTRGQTVIEEATGSTKNVIAIQALLMRGSTIDDTVTYRFFASMGATQVSTSLSGYATKYGLKTVASSAIPSGSTSDLGVNIPVSAAYGAHNTLVISESAITEMDVLRIEVKDQSGAVYQTYVTVYDISDPYDIKIESSAGEKLQNGVGSTDLRPRVWNGSSEVTDLTNWSFEWLFFDCYGNSAGNRAGFIDTSRTISPTGRTISANTVGPGAVITYSGAAISFTAGDMVKIVMPDGSPRYYEVASGNTVSNLTLRAATVSTFLNTPWSLNSTTVPLNGLVGATLYVCTGNGATAGTRTSSIATSTNAIITVTGYEIDVKGIITCKAYRP